MRRFSDDPSQMQEMGVAGGRIQTGWLLILLEWSHRIDICHFFHIWGCWSIRKKYFDPCNPLISVEFGTDSHYFASQRSWYVCRVPEWVNRHKHGIGYWRKKKKKAGYLLLLQISFPSGMKGHPLLHLLTFLFSPVPSLTCFFCKKSCFFSKKSFRRISVKIPGISDQLLKSFSSSACGMFLRSNILAHLALAIQSLNQGVIIYMFVFFIYHQLLLSKYVKWTMF